MGLCLPIAAIFKGLRDIVTRRNNFLIFDEVMDLDSALQKVGAQEAIWVTPI